MPETEYRASRVCRILGNPTAYQVIKALFTGTKTPTELAKEFGLSLQTISDALAKLRNIDLVRYEVKANERTYWLKHRSLIDMVLILEKLVRHIRIQKW
jgi:transcription initiation factor IIE alpha subunit